MLAAASKQSHVRKNTGGSASTSSRGGAARRSRSKKAARMSSAAPRVSFFGVWRRWEDHNDPASNMEIDHALREVSRLHARTLTGIRGTGLLKVNQVSLQ